MSIDPIVTEISKRIAIGKGVDLDSWADADEAAHIRNAGDFEQEVWERMNLPASKKGALMPWSNTHKDVQVRPGELSIWAGKRGSGKSLITSQVMTGLIQQGHKAVIASMEMPITVTLGRMATQALGQAMPTREFHRQFFKWADGKLFVYEQDGVVPARRLLGLARYSILALGIKNVVLDSLMMVGLSSARTTFDKLEQQTHFVRDLAAIARDNDAHIHLVAHLRKSDGNRKTSDADDVKGAGEITDLASCVYIIEANRKKVEETHKAAPAKAVMEQPDVWLKVEKNRNGPTGACFGLWSHKSLQFIGKQSHAPMQMIRGQIETTFQKEGL